MATRVERSLAEFASPLLAGIWSKADSRLRRLGLATLVVRLVAAFYGLRLLTGFVSVAVRRRTYPFELEWMEGGTLASVYRVLQGKPLYGEPSPEHMPFLYGPGYSYVGAVFAKLFSIQLGSLRLLSLLATLACVVLLALLVHAETKSPFAAWLGGMLFAGTFELSGGWFDLARVDSLALAFALGAVLAARHARRFRGFVAAGVLGACALLTKQTTLAVLPALLVFAGLRGRWRGALTLLGALLLVVAAVGIALQIQSKGWFWYYVIELPATHGTKGREPLIAGFWLDELLRGLPVASTVALLFFFGIPLGLERGARLGHTVLAASLVLGAWLARIHMGSSVNDLMPAHAALALVFGLTLHGMVAGSDPASSPRALSLAALGLVQLALLGGDLSRWMPTRADAQAGQLVVEKIRETPGEVLVVNHPHLALLAGKKPYAHQMAFIDVFEAKRDPRGVRELLRKKWSALFASHRFSMVILDNDWYVFKKELDRDYVRASHLPLGPDVLWPKIGTHFRPELVYLPKPLPTRRPANP